MDRTVLRALLELTPTARLNLGLPNSKEFIEFERAALRRAGRPDTGTALIAEQALDDLDVLRALRDELGDACDEPAGRDRVE